MYIILIQYLKTSRNNLKKIHKQAGVAKPGLRR